MIHRIPGTTKGFFKRSLGEALPDISDFCDLSYVGYYDSGFLLKLELIIYLCVDNVWSTGVPLDLS